MSGGVPPAGTDRRDAAGRRDGLLQPADRERAGSDNHHEGGHRADRAQPRWPGPGLAADRHDGRERCCEQAECGAGPAGYRPDPAVCEAEPQAQPGHREPQAERGRLRPGDHPGGDHRARRRQPGADPPQAVRRWLDRVGGRAQCSAQSLLVIKGRMCHGFRSRPSLAPRAFVMRLAPARCGARTLPSPCGFSRRPC